MSDFQKLALPRDTTVNGYNLRFFYHVLFTTKATKKHEDGLQQRCDVVTIFVDEVKAFQRDQSEPLFCNIRQEGAVL